MTVIMTGRNGQVANALLERAGAVGTSIVSLARPNFDLTASPADITEVVVEVGRKSGASLVVNAAAYTSVDNAEVEPQTAMLVNAAGAGAVAMAAKVLGVPLVHLSTDYVFGGAKKGAWVEADITCPLGAYGRSKLTGEQFVAQACVNHVILRTSWVYSPFGNNFVKTMLRIATKNETVRVVSDQFGNPTSAFDIADAIICMSRRLNKQPDESRLFGVYHLSGAGTTSWAAFATAIFASAERRGLPVASVVPVSTSAYPTPAKRPRNSALCTDKLFRVYGLQLPRWQDSLEVVLNRLGGSPA